MQTVRFNAVSKSFGHRPAMFNWLGRERTGLTQALAEVSLTAEAGEVLVLLGPNGSGKTTLLKLISTMLLPNSGSVTVCAADTVSEGQIARSKVSMAVAAERSFFPRLTARENLEFFSSLENLSSDLRQQRIASTMEATGIAEHSDTLVMKFSSGMYQRLGTARALLKQPAVLLLDEPTRSLDPIAREQFLELVRRQARCGTTVVLATHHFDEATAIGDHIVILNHGRVAGEHWVGDFARADLRSLYLQAISDATVRDEVLR